MRLLVEDRDDPAVDHGARGLRAEDVGLDQRHVAGMLHRARVVLGAEDLIVFAEGVGEAVVGLVELEALLRHLVDLVGVDVFDERLARPDAQRDLAAVHRTVDGALCARVGPGDDRHEIGRYALGGRELPGEHALACGDRLGGWRVRQDGPGFGRVDRQRELGLEIGLFEAGEDAPGVGHLELRVEVDLAVGRIDVAVQSLARARIAHCRLDSDGVLRRQVLQREARIRESTGVEHIAVEDHLVHRLGDDVEERRRPRLGGEVDLGDRGEGRLRSREVEVDAVGLGGDERRAPRRLRACQIGAWH